MRKILSAWYSRVARASGDNLYGNEFRLQSLDTQKHLSIHSAVAIVFAVNVLVFIFMQSHIHSLRVSNSNLQRYSKKSTGKETEPVPYTIVQPTKPPPRYSPKQMKIRESTLFAWNSYKKYCWGEDELIASFKTCSRSMNQSMTIVDSLDTLHIMGFEEEFQAGVEYLVQNQSYDSDIGVLVFETVIRSLGGLLSAYEITEDPRVLDKAVLLTEKLWKAVMPFPMINFKTGELSEMHWNRGNVYLAEVGSVQLEFSRLSFYTKNEKYVKKANDFIDKIKVAQDYYNGLPPAIFQITGGFRRLRYPKAGIGAFSDSYYEYLLKRWILTGKTEEMYREMYVQSANAILSRLGTTSDGKFFIGFHDGKSKNVQKTLEHLGCFYAGTLALGVYSEAVTGQEAQNHLEAAKKFAETCYSLYEMTKTGLGADIVKFTPRGIFPEDSEYLLRPEVAESMFMLWRVTHEQRWRDNAWNIYQSLEKSCRTENGVITGRQMKDGKMQSFLLAETFKYLYLTFGDDSEVSLGEYVFNTEAHPLKIRKPSESGE